MEVPMKRLMISALAAVAVRRGNYLAAVALGCNEPSIRNGRHDVAAGALCRGRRQQPPDPGV
jgi:hypothetical protein